MVVSAAALNQERLEGEKAAAAPMACGVVRGRAGGAPSVRARGKRAVARPLAALEERILGSSSKEAPVSSSARFRMGLGMLELLMVGVLLGEGV